MAFIGSEETRRDVSTNSTVAAMVAGALRRRPQADAIITEEGRVVSFAELRDRVWRLATALTGGVGLVQGDRVAVLSNNCPEYIEIDFACALTGLVKVPLYVRNSPSEHANMLHDSGAAIVIAEPRFIDPLAEILGGVSGLQHGIVALAGEGRVENTADVRDYEALIADSRATPPDHTLITATDPYQIRYTGGTSGLPKGALADHGAMLTACLGNLAVHSFQGAVGPGDVVGHAMGFSHTDAFMMSAYSWAGASHLTMRKFDPERFLALTERHRISISMMAPAMVSMMMTDPAWADRYDTSSLRSVTYGGSLMPVPVLQPALERFGPIFAQVYGMTEAPSLITILPQRDHDVDDPEILRSCGFAMPWVDLQILDENDELLPVGETGEVGVRGRNVMTEYVNRPDATREALANGWYHSGDLGYMDERGYIYLLDRKTDLIISGGYNVYPAEVENALMSHQDVLEVAVVGSEHERWGETVSAIVTVKPGAQVTLSELQEECVKHIGSYKKPRRARITEDPLPRSEFGKVLRRDLRKQFLSNPFEEV